MTHSGQPLPNPRALYRLSDAEASDSFLQASQEKPFQIQGHGDVQYVGVIPVLKEMLQDFDAAPPVRGGIEDRSLQVLLRDVMGAGKDRKKPAGPQDAKALDNEVPQSLEGARRAPLCLREGRRVQDDKVKAVPGAWRLGQVSEGVSLYRLCRKAVCGQILAGQFQGLAGYVDEPHAPCPPESRMDTEGSRVGKDVEDLKALFHIGGGDLPVPALVEKEAGLTVSLHSLTRNADFYTSGDAPNSSGWIADLIAPELSYAPIVSSDFGFELFGSWGGAVQKPESQTSDALVWRLGEMSTFSPQV